MEREFIYATVAGNSAVMRISGDIGRDVIGADFAAELAALESMGVTNITVRILSGGGSVVDGFAIFSAILNSAANITTVNDGIAASTAGWIFLAGRQAVMADYSLLMLHNPSSPDQSAKGQERVEHMRNSILTIFQKRTGVDMLALAAMMNAETWISADRAVKLGFATGVQVTEALADLSTVQNMRSMVTICNSILVKNDTQLMITENTEQVTDTAAVETVQNDAETPAEATQPTEASEPTNEANEAAVAAETDATEAVTETEVTSEVQEDTEKVELVRVNAELMQKVAELEQAMNSFKEEKQRKEDEAKQAKSLELVTNAVTLGKISNDTRDKWVDMANKDYDFTKQTLDGILVNRAGVDILKQVQNTSKIDTTKTLRQLEKENPKEVTRLFNEDRATYNQLYFNQYGIMPN